MKTCESEYQKECDYLALILIYSTKRPLLWPKEYFSMSVTGRLIFMTINEADVQLLVQRQLHTVMQT